MCVASSQQLACCSYTTTATTTRTHADEKSEYFLNDQGHYLRSNNVTLSVHWNTVPITGLLKVSRRRL